jgi:hypothetical protein
VEHCGAARVTIFRAGRHRYLLRNAEEAARWRVKRSCSRSAVRSPLTCFFSGRSCSARLTDLWAARGVVNLLVHRSSP